MLIDRSAILQEYSICPLVSKIAQFFKKKWLEFRIKATTADSDTHTFFIDFYVNVVDSIEN